MTVSRIFVKNSSSRSFIRPLISERSGLPLWACNGKIYQKIGRIAEYLSLIDGIRGDCMARFETDPVYRGALLYYLYLLADSCISLAEMVIKKKNLEVPPIISGCLRYIGRKRDIGG